MWWDASDVSCWDYLSKDHGFLTDICVRMFFSSFRILPLAEEEVLLVSSASPPSVASLPESLPRMVDCNIWWLVSQIGEVVREMVREWRRGYQLQEWLYDIYSRGPFNKSVCSCQCFAAAPYKYCITYSCSYSQSTSVRGDSTLCYSNSDGTLTVWFLVMSPLIATRATTWPSVISRYLLARAYI